jgi:hypothetical protein
MTFGALDYSSVHDTTEPQPKSRSSFILIKIEKHGDIRENI